MTSGRRVVSFVGRWFNIGRNAEEGPSLVAVGASEPAGPEELGFVEVPAGEFLMGSPEGEGDDDEHPQHSLYLPTFYIGKHPVTVGEFRQYVEGSGTFPDAPAALRAPEDNPVVRVNWHEALACAAWYGASLPSEAEWEKAARGTDGRRCPWGDEWRDGVANTREYWHGRPNLFLFGPEGGVTPVGEFSPAGDSPYGCAEMAGNVWEWTRSLWGHNYAYTYDPQDGRENLEASDQVARVLRGGGFDGGSRYARCCVRFRYFPYLRNKEYGFRLLSHSPLTSEASGL